MDGSGSVLKGSNVFMIRLRFLGVEKNCNNNNGNKEEKFGFAFKGTSCN